MWSGLCGWGSLCQRRCRGQSSCTVIHKHSYSPADGLHRAEESVCIVIEWVSGGRADQTPGLIITSKRTLITFSLPADCSYMTWYSHNISTPLQLPEQRPHTLSLHNTWQYALNLSGWSGYDWTVSVPVITPFLLDTEVFIHCVQIQNELMGIWWR